jgi:hypothetical protein
VLIIAILAAIAIPNFMEFQTRAKISRAKADMRSQVLGLEAYCVDEGYYPYGDSIVQALLRITTPIAYMSSLPVDPFLDEYSGNHAYEPYYFYYGGMQPGTGGWGGFVDDYWTNMLMVQPGVRGASNSERIIARYHIRCLGPNQIWDWSYPYDPTNGTVSMGDISYYGPANCGKGF